METGNVIAIAAAVGGFISAFVALAVYYQRLKLERAKWALNLYEKFYERDSLKDIRDILDTEPGVPEVEALVLKCPPNFTDYLNFFEFVAFLEKNGHLRRNELRALFDYYLKCINRHSRVVNFVRENGYEDLRALLVIWR
jgi:hypothetical protein